MSKLEVMGRRRWTLLLHGSLQLWKMWDFQRVCHPGDQEPTSSSRLNRKFIVGLTAKGQDSELWWHQDLGFPCLFGGLVVLVVLQPWEKLRLI